MLSRSSQVLRSVLGRRGIASGASFKEIQQWDAEYILPLYGRVPLLFTHGEGSYLKTPEGNSYLDFMSGVAVNALGHCDKEWVQAVQEQAGKLTHISNYYHNEWGAPLAKKLVESTSFASKVFYCNSGCEANEAALKFARKHAVVVSGAVVDPHTATNTNKKTKIVAFSSSFHGRTAGALSATAKLQYRLPFEPLVHGVSFAAYNDAEAAAKLVDDECAAVIVEPVQGEGGVTPASREFLQALRALCDKHHAALIFDEVQIGLARSGKLWCHEHAGVSPDILSFAKPIAAGLPMGGVLMAPHIAKAVVAGDHGTTFGGGPLVTRAAYLVLQRLSKETFLEDVRDKANYLKESLEEATAAHQASGLIQQVRGLGLLQGLVLTKPVKPVIEHSREHANVLFINAGDNVLRLAPPLTVSKSEIDEAVSAIAAALAAY